MQSDRELHALCSCCAEFPRYYHFASLGTAFHDEPQNTIACSSHGQTIEQLVSERFALGDSRETTVLNFGGVERYRVFGKFEAFLDEGSEFSNTSSLLAENLLCVSGADD